MKQTKLYVIALVITAITGCNDWLDVDPEDRVLEDKLYETEQGIQTLFNGIYMGLADNDLYGANLTTTAIEFLGQQYSTLELDVTANPVPIQLSKYDHGGPDAKSVCAAIWRKSSARILEINKFLDKIDPLGNTTESKKQLLKGEAYGLRAFLHFDQLRLFGPVYSEKPEAISIPYNTTTGEVRNPLLPANEVIPFILKDIETALALLAGDPIVKQGPLSSMTNDNLLDFYRFRTRRMNYYAVKALQARVLLYAGDVAGASRAAEEVIAVAETYFPWTTEQEVLHVSNPDRIFSGEVLFGIYSMNMYENWTDRFSPAVKNSDVYGTLEGVLQNRIFTGNSSSFDDYSDLRAKSWKRSADRTTRQFYKYEEAQTDTSFIRYFQPLIRLSEMYYIKTEEALLNENATVALNYLEVVRENRGLPRMDASSTPEAIENELLKEHIREFCGEGQIFYYYKRLNKSTILDANSSSTGTIPMSEEKYVIPLPDAELSNQ